MVGVLVTLVLVSADLTRVATKDQRPPVTINQVEVLNSPVEPGQKLQVRVVGEKVRDDCAVTADRWAISEDGIIFQLGSLTSRGAPVGSQPHVVEYPIPVWLPEGTYILRVRLAYMCPDGPHLLKQPDTRFRVKLDMEGRTSKLPLHLKEM